MVICNTYIHYGIMGLAFLALLYTNISMKVKVIDHIRDFNKKLTSMLVLLIVSVIILFYIWNIQYANCPLFLS